MQRIQDAAARSRRDPASIRLIGVTKTVSVDSIREAVKAGVTEIGENRLQEALSKKPDLADLELRWHFIGHRRTTPCHHCLDLAAETLFIELERRLALALESKSWIQLHGLAPLVM